MDILGKTSERLQERLGLANTFHVSYIVILCVCFFLGRLYLQESTGPLPPGPKPLPVIGNLHQLLSKPFPDTLQEWHRKYGPVVCFRTGSRVILSIASHEICKDLIARKGSIYNSRPHVVVGGHHATKGLHIALMPFGKRWVTHRHILASLTTVNTSRKYRPLEDVESRQVLVDFLRSNDFSAIFRRYGASVTRTLSYGRRLTHEDEADFQDTEQLGRRITAAVDKFHFAFVELFPVLDHLPGFLAPWKAFGTKYFTDAISFYSRNLKEAQDTPAWNWVKQSLTRPEAQNMPTDEISMLFGATMQAGVESLPAMLCAFIKAMILHPESMRKAQKELDEVVGSERLPSFDDMPFLPYTNGLVKECCRWQGPSGLGIPHCTIQDDEYKGYHVPKGTVVFANAWAIGLDEQIYERPSEFLPERWVDNPDLPEGAAFGYGRRVCPAMYIGLDSLFINISRVLWAYSVTHGRPEGAPWDRDHALTASPTELDAQFQIRSDKHQEVVEAAWSIADKDANIILEKIEAEYHKA